MLLFFITACTCWQCDSHPAFTQTVGGSNASINVAMCKQWQWKRRLLASKYGCKQCGNSNINGNEAQHKFNQEDCPYASFIHNTLSFTHFFSLPLTSVLTWFSNQVSPLSAQPIMKSPSHFKSVLSSADSCHFSTNLCSPPQPHSPPAHQIQAQFSLAEALPSSHSDPQHLLHPFISPPCITCQMILP